jgi:hypothetical protein
LERAGGSRPPVGYHDFEIPRIHHARTRSDTQTINRHEPLTASWD